jgi:hypothetical protein
MKRFLKTFLLSAACLYSASTYSQGGSHFEFNEYRSLIYEMDTVSNPNCTWQVGKPVKNVFKAAYSPSRALMTDTVNPVPPGDTSRFFIYHHRDKRQPFHVFYLEFKFRLDGDSSDFGSIEISADGGTKWINLLKEDSMYKFKWHMGKPSLSGSTDNWMDFSIDMTSWSSHMLNDTGTADTLIFCFTYVTDNSSGSRDGWMIDDLHIGDYYESIQAITTGNSISIYPNPVASELHIQARYVHEQTVVRIYDHCGKLIHENREYDGHPIDTRGFKAGLYLLRYSDAKSTATGTFVIQH